MNNDEKLFQLMQSLATKIDSIENKMDERFDFMEQRFDSMEQRFDKIETRMNNLESEQKSLSNQIAVFEDKVDNRLKALFDARDLDRKQLDSISEKLEQVSQDIDSHDLEIIAVKHNRYKRAN